MENKIQEVAWKEVGMTSWLTISTTVEAHISTSSHAGGGDFTVFSPTEDDMLMLIEACSKALREMREANVG